MIWLKPPNCRSLTPEPALLKVRRFAFRALAALSLSVVF